MGRSVNLGSRSRRREGGQSEVSLSPSRLTDPSLLLHGRSGPLPSRQSAAYQSRYLHHPSHTQCSADDGPRRLYVETP